MAKQKTKTNAKRSNPTETRGEGGEAHYLATSAEQTLTTNQGIPVADNQNSLRTGARGPTLLEDFVLREKITHFDHERIPERIVHARGTGAHGYFQVYKSQASLTKADFLQTPDVKTPVFVRFSTVAGGAGSVDIPRDVRGFAVKFYTQEGNFDLVGNNIPVFFIQDAIKFPDLIHSVKMEADRGFPQAASAHDTFWDFVSLMPESMHMLTWVMSDRAIPRSYRMIQGFGIHTFRFVNRKGDVSFVKFHWRPLLGAQSVVWDEAVKINGADNDFHRRDLWEAIDSGNYPEFEFGVQVFDEEFAANFDFDVLDSTKLIPEELVPLQIIGKMVLDRNVDNFFAETEQAAFHPANIVPGIDFSEDPLLQGRLFSYQDTQLIRLGGPNFHQIPINQPKCPMRNFQRDGFMQMAVPTGRANYEPNSIDPASPREDPKRGFVTVPVETDGPKIRVRSETFSDHYSQARMFYRSLTEPEQRHMASAFAFELGKVVTVAIRTRMLGHLMLIDPDLGATVEEALGMQDQADQITPAREPIDVAPSPALSILANAPQTIQGRQVGILISDGVPAALLKELVAAVQGAGAKGVLIAPKIGGVTDDGGKKVVPDHALSSAPSVFFDAVVLALSEDGATQLATQAAAVDFVRDAFGHLKIIGFAPGATSLLQAAGISDKADEGLVSLATKGGARAFVSAAKQHRIWSREPSLRDPG